MKSPIVRYFSNKKQQTIRFTVVSIFLLATFITAFIAISLQYHFSQSMAKESARQLFSLTSQKTQEHLSSIDYKASNINRIFSHYNGLVEGDQVNESVLSTFTEILKNNNDFYAMYIGFKNGDFYEVINLESSPVIRNQLSASHKDRWVILEVNKDNGDRQRIFSYLDEALNIRVTRSELTDYDASTRNWYTNAKERSFYKTAPYMFQHLQAPGQTYSSKIAGTNAVFAIDIALSSLDGYLAKQSLSTSTNNKEMYLFQQSGEVISSNQKSIDTDKKSIAIKLPLSQIQKQIIANTPPLKVSNQMDWAPIDFTISGQPKGYSIDVLSLVSEMTGLTFEYTNGFTWSELVQGYEKRSIDILQPVFNTDKNKQRGMLSDSLVNIPFAIITSQHVSPINHIKQLQGKTLAIPKGWSIISVIKQHFPEINIVEYPSTKAVLDAVSTNEVYSGIDNEIILKNIQQQFFIENIQYHSSPTFSPAKLETSLHLIFKPEQLDVMEIVNLAIHNITKQQRDSLNQRWLMSSQIDSQKKAQGVVPYAQLIDLAKQKNEYGKLIPLDEGHHEKFVYITPVNKAKTEFLAIVVTKSNVFADSLAKVKLSILITCGCLLLVLPVSWLFSGPIVKPIKLLAIENEKIQHRQYEKVSFVKSNIKEIDALATSLIDMSNAIRTHEQKQQELMDAFIKLIAQTIDDKSAYTGGHCNRVPELGLMLADAAQACTNDKLKDFSFKSKDELREFKIAAWLHDCGKIITPEHIVDKGSKLEAIYNRIHEVRMRFEVLWRDAEIAFYQTLINKPEQKATLQKDLLAKQEKLIDEFTFVANTNVGSEFMAPEKINKLQKISEQTWQRHFDDKLGLSPVEELHAFKLSKQHLGSENLPVTEKLLSDKTEHLFEREQSVTLDEKLGIKMPIPLHKANLGELYNLSISRGTLTAEDRYIINEHIIGTIKILDQLPFPAELANVPKFASTHHETLKGTGYPRKLEAKDLTIPERILVIADIFEALTAADRPYKKAKPLSVAIDILHKFALDEHIDIDLFELFLTSKTYLAYAEKFMKKEQIDTVDLTKYLRG